jgi:hypothetical protein
MGWHHCYGKINKAYPFQKPIFSNKEHREMKRTKSKETEIFYITKYWNTEGILKRKCRIVSYSDDKRSYASYNENSEHGFWPIGTEAFSTETEARQRIAELQKRKIASLTKQIEKLERIDPVNIPIVD